MRRLPGSRAQPEQQTLPISAKTKKARKLCAITAAIAAFQTKPSLKRNPIHTRPSSLSDQTKALAVLRIQPPARPVTASYSGKTR
jgi:hypothetical protein